MVKNPLKYKGGAFILSTYTSVQKFVVSKIFF